MISTRKTFRVQLEGGFHNVAPIVLRVRSRFVYTEEDGTRHLVDGWVPTESQHRRLEKHFCGIPSCICGGVSRATAEVLD